MCVSAGSPVFCFVLINNSLSKRIAGAGGGTTEKWAVLQPVGACLGACQGGTLARRSRRGTGSSGRLFSQLGVAACAKHLMPGKHENRSEDTVSGRPCSSWGGRHMFP